MNNPNINIDDEQEIDLLALLQELLSKWYLLVLVGLLGCLLSFNYCEYIATPTYTSTTKVYIMTSTGNDSTVTTSDLTISSQFADDYMELVESRTIIEAVISELDLDYTYEQLSSMISTSSASTSSRILSISVEDKSPKEAMEIANSLRELVSNKIVETMNADSVNIVESANLPTKKTSPSLLKYSLISGAVFEVIIIAIIVIHYLLDDSIKTSEDVENYLGLSVLTQIPKLSNESSKKARNKNKHERSVSKRARLK